MRVLMLNNEFPPLGGGTATANLMLLCASRDIPGLSIDLVTATAGSEPQTEQFSEHITLYKVPVGDINPHHARHRDLLTYTIKGLAMARKLARQQTYDVALAWHAVPAGAMALWLRLAYKIPYVIRIGGSDLPGFERRYRRVSTLLLPLLYLTWRSASTIVVKCADEERHLRRFYRSGACTTIPNGVDTDTFTPAAARGEDSGPLRLIIVARLIPRKGHTVLFSALKTLINAGHKATLDIVGTGDTEAACRKHVQALGLKEFVTFHGAQPREVLPEFYRRACVFVLPSENEGMSNATLEAMASGLAIVVTQTGTTEAMLEEGKNGFVFAVGDADGLAKHLITLAKDPHRVLAMGAYSRHKAQALSWPRAAATYAELFRTITTARH